MKVIKWIIVVLLILVIVFTAAGFVFMKLMGIATAPNEYTENVAELMRSSLDTPFLFILENKDFSVKYLTKDSDLVSTWGYLVLQQTPNAPSIKNTLFEDLTQIAKKYHWQLGNVDSDDMNLQDVMDKEIDFTAYGINHTKPDLVFTQIAKSANNQGPPTRYLSRLWVSEDSNNLIMSFRVDSE